MQNKDTFKNLRNYILGLKNQLLEMELENKEEYKVKLDLIYNKIKSPVFRIGFISTFSTGKSTIINALLGKEILPVAEKSTTGCITTITYGEEDKVEIILKDNKIIGGYYLKINPEDSSGYLNFIALSDKFKRTKTGFACLSKMANSIAKNLQQNDLNELTWETNYTNLQARKLFKKLNAENIGQANPTIPLLGFKISTEDFKNNIEKLSKKII